MKILKGVPPTKDGRQLVLTYRSRDGETIAVYADCKEGRPSLAEILANL